MTRDERLNSIFTQFDRCAEAFCQKTGGINCDISSVYKNNKETPSHLKFRVAKIEYRSHIVQFLYTAHSTLGAAHSILECHICFGKEEETDIPVPLPMVADFCNTDIAEPFVIPYIGNETAMEQAFSCIAATVETLMPSIEAIAYDEQKKQEVAEYFVQEYRTVTGDTSEAIFFDKSYFNFMTLRFASLPYILAMKGKTDKAIKEFGKMKLKYRCEERLIKRLESKQEMNCEKIPAVFPLLEMINDKGVSKSEVSEFLPLFLSWLILAIPASAVYTGIYFLLIALQQQNTVYLTGVMTNFPYCILAGLVTGIALSYFARLRIIRLFSKKNYEQTETMDHLTNGAGSDKLMRGFLYVVVFLGTACMIFFSTWNLNFKEDGFIDNTAFFSLTGTYHSYDDIDCIRYIPDRENGFSETIEFPSYMLVMKNGKEIDLYEYDDTENYESVLIGFLQKKGISLVK